MTINDTFPYPIITLQLGMDKVASHEKSLFTAKSAWLKVAIIARTTFYNSDITSFREIL